MEIRGYGPVKTAAIDKVKAEVARLMAGLPAEKRRQRTRRGLISRGRFPKGKGGPVRRFEAASSAGSLIRLPLSRLAAVRRQNLATVLDQ